MLLENLSMVLSKILNMSITAGIVIAAVMLLRLALRKAPKIYSYLLWFIVLFRLLCPVSVSSAASLMGLFNTPVTEEEVIAYIPFTDNFERTITTVNFEIIPDGYAAGKQQEENRPETVYELKEIMTAVGGILWIAGMIGLLLYSVLRLVKLLKKLVGSIKIGDGIYRADHIETPFVIGIIFPKVYLPSGLTETEKEYILMHEKHHIKRGDHIYKLLFYTVLCVYWFNPFVWAAFYLFVKDMEMSCDEAVMSHMKEDIRAEYSESLLCLATGRHILHGMPLAFGEGDTGDRIKNILKWKKPKAGVIAAALLLCITAAVCLLTNPESSAPGAKDSLGVESVFERNPASGEAVYVTVEEALRAAVIKYYQSVALPSDFSCAGVLACSVDTIAPADDNTDVQETAVYYVFSMYKDMNFDEDGITELVTVSAAPMAITLISDAGGGYRVDEDGVLAVNELSENEYKNYMEVHFPEAYQEEYQEDEFRANHARSVLDIYEKLLCMDCHAQAVEYGQLDTDAIIGGLVDDIASEPLESSVTRDYINHAPVEYRELIYYGQYTGAYARSYRQTGAADLKMDILNYAVADINNYTLQTSGRGTPTDIENHATILGASQEYHEELAAIQELDEELAEMQEEIERYLVMLEEQNEELAARGEYNNALLALHEYNNELLAIQEHNDELIAEQEENEEMIAMLQQKNEEITSQREYANHMIDSINHTLVDTAVWPKADRTISLAYGNQQGNDGKEYFSDHICIAGSEGDPVYAAMDGVVETTGFTADYGNYIVILSGDEIRTRYGHLKSIEAEEGMQVTAGQEIGTLGRTGRATGNCLHFAITVHGIPVDPSGVNNDV